MTRKNISCTILSDPWYWAPIGEHSYGLRDTVVKCYGGANLSSDYTLVVWGRIYNDTAMEISCGLTGIDILSFAQGNLPINTSIGEAMKIAETLVLTGVV